MSGKLAKRGLPNRETLVFKAFMSAEYFANPRKLGKVLKLSSFPQQAFRPLSEMAGRGSREQKPLFL
jgi:hypothetical protein